MIGATLKSKMLTRNIISKQKYIVLKQDIAKVSITQIKKGAIKQRKVSTESWLPNKNI